MSITTPVSKTIALIACFFAGTVYLALVSSQYLAFRFSQRADLDSLRMAVRLQPGNAEYRFRLGEYYSVTQQLQQAVDSYGTAAALNSPESGYWIRFAAAVGLF